MSLNLNLYTLILLILQVVDNGVTTLNRTETETENIMEEEIEKETDREVLQGAGQNLLLLCPPVQDEVGLIVNIVIMTMTATGTGMEVPSHLGVEIGMEMAMAMGTAMEVVALPTLRRAGTEEAITHLLQRQTLVMVTQQLPSPLLLTHYSSQTSTHHPHLLVHLHHLWRILVRSCSEVNICPNHNHSMLLLSSHLRLRPVSATSRPRRDSAARMAILGYHLGVAVNLNNLNIRRRWRL